MPIDLPLLVVGRSCEVKCVQRVSIYVLSANARDIQGTRGTLEQLARGGDHDVLREVKCGGDVAARRTSIRFGAGESDKVDKVLIPGRLPTEWLIRR